MKSTMKALGLAAAVALVGMPALADMDVPATTCGDFTALDAAGKTNYATDLVIWINDANNAEQAKGLQQYCNACNAGIPDDLIRDIEARCAAGAATDTVVDRLQGPH